MLELFFTFFKLGLFTFGGGYAMIPLIKETIINKKKWMNEDEVLEMIAIAESTPGPIAINMATYIGHRQKGIIGSALATLGVILPSMIIIYLISLCFDMFLANEYIQYAFTGIKCGVAILILKTGIEMLLKARKNIPYTIIAIVVTALMVALDILAINLSAIILILLGGIVVGVVGNIVKEKMGGDDIDKMVADVYKSASKNHTPILDNSDTIKNNNSVEDKDISTTTLDDIYALDDMIQQIEIQHAKDRGTTIETITVNNGRKAKSNDTQKEVTLDDSEMTSMSSMFDTRPSANLKPNTPKNKTKANDKHTTTTSKKEVK